MKTRAVTNKKPGFTLIEVLVVSAILVMLLLTASTMFMTFLVSNAKTNVRQQLKAEGQQVLSKIEYDLRNARAITSTCPGTSNSITYTDLSNTSHTIDRASNTIRIDANAITTPYASATSLTFTCEENADSGSTFVSFNFVLANRNAAEIGRNTNAGQITESFFGRVSLRNF